MKVNKKLVSSVKGDRENDIYQSTKNKKYTLRNKRRRDYYKVKMRIIKTNLREPEAF